MFLRTMKPKALAKLRSTPGCSSASGCSRRDDLYEFDNVFTAPLHGFRDTDDYWTRGSAKPHLQPHPRAGAGRSTRATTRSCRPPRCRSRGSVGRCVTLWQPAHGGHVGFAGGAWPGHVRTLPASVMAWIAQQL